MVLRHGRPFPFLPKLQTIPRVDSSATGEGAGSTFPWTKTPHIRTRKVSQFNGETTLHWASLLKLDILG